MKLKFSKGIFLCLSTIALLSFESCKKNESTPASDTTLDLILTNYNENNKIENTDDSKILQKHDQLFVDWSWQKFLWLTSNTDENIPVFMKDFKQVTDFGGKIRKVDLINKGLDESYLKDDKLPLILDLYHQADGTVLEGYNNDIVRYSIHANDGILNMFESDDATKIINKAAELIKSKTSEESIRLSNDKYPIGATEIKIAWIKTSEVIDSTKTFNITAIVNDPSENLYSSYKNAKKERMSMIGFHIFTVTAQHPEGIWSTFDQRELAPERTSIHGTPVNPMSDKYTFFDVNFSGNTEDGIIQDTTTNKPKVKNKVFQSYPYGVRYNENKDVKGMVVNSFDLKFSNMIKLSNELVQKTLTNDKVKIWANYKLIGSIWSKTNANIDDLLDGDLSKPYEEGIGKGKSFGSFNLANVTMETTFQNKGMNCFTCHSMGNTLYKFYTKEHIKVKVKTPLITSHLFEKYVELKADSIANAENKLIKSTISEMKNYIREASRQEAKALLLK